MATKYKYGKDGSYFDPETKRTYYKDPQYQKAYDDEWNRLEKLYRARQEEQRRIERENFQRVLTQADALRRSLRASGIAPTPQPWTPYRNEFKKGGSTKSDEGYYEYMEKVAENNAAKWGMSEDEALLHLLNDPTDNYKAYYEANKAKPNFDGSEESEIERNVELPEITVYPNSYYYYPHYNSETKELGYQRGLDFTTERPPIHLIREFEYPPLTYPIEKPLQPVYPEFDALLGITGGAFKTLKTIIKHLKTIFKPKHRDYLKRVLKEGFDELAIDTIEDKVVDEIIDE